MIHSLLVPLDGNRSNETILPAALELARASDARVTLLHVLSSRFGATQVNGTPADDWDRTMIEAEDYLLGLRDRLRDEGLRVEAIVFAHPDPPSAICEIAEELDVGLIALVADEGHASVTTGVLSTSRRPVLVHPRRGRPDTPPA